MRRQIVAWIFAGACALAMLALGSLPPVAAQQPPTTFADPNAGLNPAEFGQVSPFIPMQSTEAVHMGLVWKRGSDRPKLLYHARFPEYEPNDVADPAIIDALTSERRNPITGRSRMDNGVIDFNLSLRDVLNPLFRNGSDPTADSFQRLTYGGYRLQQGLSQSVPTRIVANRTMERQLIFDPFHPAALRNLTTNPKFHTALLDEADFALNRAAFTENGYSKGMFYNTYCNARVTLADGRVYVFGGHDMQSDNGLYKVNVFDPETEEWVERAEPCTRANWAADPFGEKFFAANPLARPNIDAFFPGCDQRIQQSTQPSDPSDQKYARWYPSAAPLPNGWVLVIGGFDQDATVPPDPTRATRTGPQNDAEFTATRVNIVVPEVYDPVSDRNIALENARMAFPLYPQMEVVQTGPGKDDWQVCTLNGEINYGAIADERYRDASGAITPGGARFGVGGGTPGFENGNMWCLDVIGAMKDRNRNVPAKKHWTLVDTAQQLRPYCCPTASVVEINANGQTVSHKWFQISGQDENGEQTGLVEEVEFFGGRPGVPTRTPRYRPVGNILQPLSTTKAVQLPDGKVLIGQGVNRSANCRVTDEITGQLRPCNFIEKEGLHFQMFDPADGSIRRLARTTVSRGLHGTATLLPDGSVFFAGENREALVRPDDPSFPLAASWAPDGVLMQGDQDQGVPVGQIFYPPYLFASNGSRAPRPEIRRLDREIDYRGHFDIEVRGRADAIGSVALLRSDHNTHSLTAGDRYIKLAFRVKGNARDGRLRVSAPTHAAQAVPGVYMLFVLDKNGVPSVGRQVRIFPESRGKSSAFR
jgi:hypothetical protein